MIRLLLLLIVMACPMPVVAATPLLGDVSNYRIDIDSSFNGTRIFLFGARNDNGDIVVVVRGPGKDYIVRKKERIAGIWVNRSRMRFINIPDFYAIAASRSLDDMNADVLLRKLGIGQMNLLPPVNAKSKDFSDAFLRYQLTRRLYLDVPEKVTFMAETLFKTVIEFPDNIPAGNYTAEIYLLSDDEIVGMQSTPISVVKSGFDAFLYVYAHQHPALYGISAVVIALCVGWFTGRAFEKIGTT